MVDTILKCLGDDSLFVTKAAVSCMACYIWQLLSYTAKDRIHPTVCTNTTNVCTTQQQAINSALGAITASLLAPLENFSKEKSDEREKSVGALVDILHQLCGQVEGNPGALRSWFEDYHIRQGLIAAMEEMDWRGHNCMETTLDVLLADTDW